MSDKKAYSYDEITEILNDNFEHFVLVGTATIITDDGVSDNNTFMARQGNLSCCYGLAYQASNTIQQTIDALSWNLEEEDDD